MDKNEKSIRIFKAFCDFNRLKIIDFLKFELQQKKLISLLCKIIDKNIIHLTPVIDFARSFGAVSFNFYYNPYISIPKDAESIDRFLNDFPEVYKYFLEIFSIGTEELVNCIEANYPIMVDDRIKENYDKVVSGNQKILKKIGNRTIL